MIEIRNKWIRSRFVLLGIRRSAFGVLCRPGCQTMNAVRFWLHPNQTLSHMRQSLVRRNAVFGLRVGTMGSTRPSVGRVLPLPGEGANTRGKAGLPSASPTRAGETPALRGGAGRSDAVSLDWGVRTGLRSECQMMSETRMIEIRNNWIRNRFVLLGIWRPALVFFAVGQIIAADPATRQTPPPGIPIADGARRELELGAAALGQEIQALRAALKEKPVMLELLPDVQIFHKAVDWAARYDEFYRSNDVDIARALLLQGMERAAQLRTGEAPWTNATGLIVRGYASRIGGSVQPYGLV